MSVFFIGGAPRTGTSLLNAILCSDETVHPILPEAKYIRHLMRAYRYGRDAFDVETKEYFAHPEGLRAFTAHQIEAICEALMLRFPGTLHQVFKNPEMTPVLPDLLQILPEARAVITIRDPRDMVASLITLHDRQKEEGQESWVTRAGRDAAIYARTFNGIYSPISNLPEKALYRRMLTIRYEDMVEDTETSLTRIAGFTGLDVTGFSEDPAWRAELRAKVPRAVSVWRGDLWGGPVTASSVGNFHEVLKPEEISAVEDICAPYLDGFGYQPV